MTLYLCIFEGDEELDGVQVGRYEDFCAFRDHVAQCLEGGEQGRRFPTLMLHSGYDGEWSPQECERLLPELETIRSECRQLPAVPFNTGWKTEVARTLGLAPASAFDSFFDVDGQPLLDRHIGLAQLAVRTNRAILFQ